MKYFTTTRLGVPMPRITTKHTMTCTCRGRKEHAKTTPVIHAIIPKGPPTTFQTSFVLRKTNMHTTLILRGPTRSSRDHQMTLNSWGGGSAWSQLAATHVIWRQLTKHSLPCQGHASTYQPIYLIMPAGGEAFRSKSWRYCPFVLLICRPSTKDIPNTRSTMTPPIACSTTGTAMGLGERSTCSS